MVTTQCSYTIHILFVKTVIPQVWKDRTYMDLNRGGPMIIDWM